MKHLPFSKNCATRFLQKLTILVILSAGIFLQTNLSAQPSGGPYGPTLSSFELPKLDKGHAIIFVSPDGSKDSEGTTPENPTSLESAVTRAKTEDAIILRGGIYRTGKLVINQSVLFQAYLNERPIIKGTKVATDWKKQDNGLWVTHWDTLFPSEPYSWWDRQLNGKSTPLHLFNNDMVFVNGKLLWQVAHEGDLDKDFFCIDYKTGLVYIATDPTDKLVEITAYDLGLLVSAEKVNGKQPDDKGPTLRGLTFTQYANRALEIDGSDPQHISPEEQNGKVITDAVIEECELSFCSRTAAFLKGDRLIFRKNKVSDTVSEGIYLVASNDVLFEKNIFTRNNIERQQGIYPAAVKIFNQTHRVVCRNNLVIDHPYSNGIWYDVGNVDGVFINNWVENVGLTHGKQSNVSIWENHHGFMFEISKGAICAGNVFVNCDNGVFILNSSNVTVAQNTFYNSVLNFGRDGRSAEGDLFGWHPSSGPAFNKRLGHKVYNNLLTGDSDFVNSLLVVWQPESLKNTLKEPQLDACDHNIYVMGNPNSTAPYFHLNPTGKTPETADVFTEKDFTLLPDHFSDNSLMLKQKVQTVFQNPQLSRFEMINTFQPEIEMFDLPENITKYLGLTNGDIKLPGAYCIYSVK